MVIASVFPWLARILSLLSLPLFIILTGRALLRVSVYTCLLVSFERIHTSAYSLLFCAPPVAKRAAFLSSIASGASPNLSVDYTKPILTLYLSRCLPGDFLNVREPSNPCSTAQLLVLLRVLFHCER